MSFDREVYLARIKPGTVINDTGIVTVLSSALMPYEVAGVHYLAPDENQGRQNIFVDVLDANGRPLVRPPGLRVGWTWKGRNEQTEPAPPAPFEKLPPEAAANVAVFPGQTVTLWLEDMSGHRVSQQVTGFRTNLAGDGSGSRPGHNSFYVVFRPVRQVSEPPIVPDGEDKLRAALRSIQDILNGLNL